MFNYESEFSLQMCPKVKKINKKTKTSRVGALSKAQKAQNLFRKIFEIYEKIFVSKKLHSAKKCKLGDPSVGFENIQSVAKYQKIQSGDTSGTSGFLGYVKKVLFALKKLVLL